MRDIEQRNARLRAELFAKLFGRVWRSIRKLMSYPHLRRCRKRP